MAPSRPTKDRETKEARVLANRYEVVKKLGSGNFGTAFLCKDRKCNNEFKVLKEISVGDLQPDETVDAMHEARLLSKLNHPGIVKFHDSFIDGEFFCIVTEYCEGGDLDHKITEFKKSGKSIDEKNVLSWIIQLLLAVQYMHSRRVLHRDLKTRNIFIRNNRMKIGDFGISRILMGTTDMASTFTGTPYYMSPEVLKHEGYNSKSDVWSIGCIMYELCTLEHAFMGQGLMAVMYKIVEKDAPDLPSKYSKNLNEVFKTMLIKEPEKRPSATEVLKLPYITQSMAKMKDTIAEGKHSIDQEEANREASELAVLLREKSHLDDLRSTYESVGDSLEDSHTLTVAGNQGGHEEGGGGAKKLTARERLRIKKMQEADRRAQDLKQAAKVQLVENTERREKLKMSLEKKTMPAWKGGYGEGTILKEAITVRDPRKDKPYRPKEYPEGYLSSDEEDEELKTVLHQTVVRRNSERSTPGTLHTPDRLTQSLTRGTTPRTLTDHTPNTLSITVRQQHHHSSAEADERPITPMRDLMVYDREHSSLDFKDGVPETPDLANTFYEQYNDFENDEEDSDNADVVVGGRLGDEENTLVKDDQEALMDYLAMALEKSSGESTIVSDDTVLGPFGPRARETKIKNIRGECIKILGETEFQKAYKYLREARSGKNGKEKSEKEIMDGLRKFVKNPSDCFMVDQLLFLEDQAKLSS
ncbi:serine/threonine-protein kinase nek11 [Plakobranchus ocellatus]|uniref:non-specific serine/threonine protein kinase n=1 Tax=Plakobranchus ocellatus TaxID=259542 RepID=A0AAV3Y9P7_9GAST|nr:serine/threonine-protein kinase nek11 [Plakobranchus ocellatus]